MLDDEDTVTAEGTPDPRKAWETVLASIEGDLLSGRLGPGDHLPPERALATALGVGRSSVREAVRVLEVLGLIRTQTGSGPQSGAIIVARPSGGMSLLMRLQVAARAFPVDDVVSTRLILEAAIATQLASGPFDLSPARELLDSMDAPGLGAADFLALDAQFHVSLAAASTNTVLAAMMAGLRDSVEGYVLASAPDADAWPDTAARLRAEHRGIVAAIDAGDPDTASARIRDHIHGYYLQTTTPKETPW
ncbi:FadR/GntR family transcriptional regulator [Marisediminicola senii]|uniref:FadR/GntR family transcriptional regulator n=1 Tax=Marisediminicola senii TaxID=2711233 RepID=UPI0013EB1108|nr:FCD domain-containing protein [Marisediminicola senii]